MTIFPWLIVGLLMLLVAELVVVGPRALRSLRRRGEGLHVESASLRPLVGLVLLQIAVVIGWAVLFRHPPG